MSEQECDKCIMCTIERLLHRHHGKREHFPSWQFARCSSFTQYQKVPGKSFLLLFSPLILPTFNDIDLVSLFCRHFQTDDWVEIQVICTSRKIMVRESGKELASADVAYKLDQFKEFYVGGAPLELRERC